MGSSFSICTAKRRKVIQNLNSKKISHFDTVPDELIKQIFAYIDNDQLIGSVGRVCKRWRAISRDGTLWEHVWLTNPEWNVKSLEADLIETADLIKRHTKSLYATGEHLLKMNLSQLELIESCNRLQYLTIRTHSMPEEFGHGLRSLEFEARSDRLTSPWIPISLGKVAAELFSQLTVQRYPDDRIITVMYQKLRGCENIENRIDRFIDYLVEISPNLHALDLLLYNPTDEFGFQVTTELTRRNRGEGKFLRDLVRRLPELNFLVLNYDEALFRSPEPIDEGIRFDEFLKAFLSPEHNSSHQHLVLSQWPVEHIESIIQSINVVITPEVDYLCLFVYPPVEGLPQSTRNNFKIIPFGDTCHHGSWFEDIY